MSILVVHDGSVMSELLVSDFSLRDSKLTALVNSATDDATLRAACEVSSSAVFISTGWDPASAEREINQLQVVIGGLEGSMKRLLYVSDSTVIGDTGASFGNEDSPRSSNAPHPWRVLAEQRLTDAGFRGVHCIIVRPALIHGHGAGELLQRLHTHAAKTGDSVYVGHGLGRVSTVHVDDVISLIAAALVRAPHGGVYPAASEEIVTWRDVADVVARATGGSCKVQSIDSAEAAGIGLDAATMGINNVIRDRSAHRRIGWRTSGELLVR
jgi:nucleoside-diphosphate-sugar epimerase